MAEPRPWESFKPAPYALKSEVGDLKLSRRLPDGKGGRGQVTTTSVADVYREFVESRADLDDFEADLLPFPFTSDRSESTAHSLVLALIRLKAKGVEPWEARWFWYSFDENWEYGDGELSWIFFVVGGERIVAEDVGVTEGRRGKDGTSATTIFTDYIDEDSDPGDQEIADATARFWYRKFYTETITGQIEVMRADEPPLICFPEGRAHRLAITGSLSESAVSAPPSIGDAVILLAQITTLLRWLVVLGAIATVALLARSC